MSTKFVGNLFEISDVGVIQTASHKSMHRLNMCWNFQTETSIEQICAGYRPHNVALAYRYNADFESHCQQKEIANGIIFSLPSICGRPKSEKKLRGSYELHFLRYLNLQSNGQAQMSEIN